MRVIKMAEVIRMRWSAALAASLGLALAAPMQAEQPTRIYVGTYTGEGAADSKGIYVVDFDPQSGKLSPPRLAAATPNPSFLTLDAAAERLYSVAELRRDSNRWGASVMAWRIEPDGTLKELARADTGGDGPCFVALNRQETLAGVANYGGGSVNVYSISPESPLKLVDFVQHTGSSVNKARQSEPHAHSFQFLADGTLAMAADLGTDELIVYDVSPAGKLTRNEQLTFQLPAGHGPRHFALSPDEQFVLVIEELSSIISVLRITPERLQMIGEYSTLPADFTGNNSTAEIQFHPSGRFVYGSNRGHHSLAVFAFDAESGRLEARGHVSSGGQTPRNFRPSPDGQWLITANQESNNLVVFKVGDDGLPVPTGNSVTIPKPVCIKFNY